jgi:tetratricopeptide (TPR) repeat protein
MKSIYLSLALSCFCLVAIGQNEYLRAAEKYFSEEDYYSASQYYEKYLAGEKPRNASGFNPYAVSATSTRTPSSVKVNKETVLYKLAESYRLLNFHVKAEPNYRQLIETGTKFPLARYHFATTLRALSKFDEAEAMFNTFLSEYKTEDIYSEIV